MELVESLQVQISIMNKDPIPAGKTPEKWLCLCQAIPKLRPPYLAQEGCRAKTRPVVDGIHQRGSSLSLRILSEESRLLIFWVPSHAPTVTMARAGQRRQTDVNRRRCWAVEAQSKDITGYRSWIDQKALDVEFNSWIWDAKNCAASSKADKLVTVPGNRL